MDIFTIFAILTLEWPWYYTYDYWESFRVFGTILEYKNIL